MRLFLFDRFHGLEEIICASADLDLLPRAMLIARVPSRPKRSLERQLRRSIVAFVDLGERSIQFPEWDSSVSGRGHYVLCHSDRPLNNWRKNRTRLNAVA